MTSHAVETTSLTCKLNYRKKISALDATALNETFASLKSPSIIGANSARKDAERFSYWAADPIEVFEFKTGQAEPFKKLNAALNKYKLLEQNKTELPKGIFQGGWIGYFSYELGRHIEKIPQTTIDDLKMPLIRLCFYDSLIAFDHKENCFWLIALEMADNKSSAETKLDELEKLLDKAADISIPQSPAPDMDNIDLTEFHCNMDKQYYLRSLEKIKKHIFDGDVYQINFSQRFDCDYTARPIDLFHWQNQHNPSPYSAYIDAGDLHIVSASPEMFITINDGLISTKPIKGTRPRTGDEKTDDKNYNELLHSTKEKAELNMIVDLERNDLARICQPGTRGVSQPRTIETYPTVFHAVATIAGKLKNQISFCDILKAMFPGGSITGAPKVSAMEIIDRAEPTARGVYTGSIAMLGLDKNASLNIAIRTIIITGGKAYAQTGGGIVADSDPESEWAETITKARALLAGIKAAQKKANKK